MGEQAGRQKGDKIILFDFLPSFHFCLLPSISLYAYTSHDFSKASVLPLVVQQLESRTEAAMRAQDSSHPRLKGTVKLPQ